MSERDPETQTPAPDGQPATEQPDWRRQFPIDMREDHYVARREFTKFLSLTSLAFVVGHFWILARAWLAGQPRGTPTRKLIGSEADLRRALARTGAYVFHYPDHEQACLLLLHPDGTSLVAYDQHCTHLSCAVVPDPHSRCLLCPCHHGRFDGATGRPLAGPPRRPLARIHLEMVGGNVYAIDKEVRTV